MGYWGWELVVAVELKHLVAAVDAMGIDLYMYCPRFVVYNVEWCAMCHVSASSFHLLQLVAAGLVG